MLQEKMKMFVGEVESPGKSGSPKDGKKYLVKNPQGRKIKLEV